jgi:hypothetical protein
MHNRVECGARTAVTKHVLTALLLGALLVACQPQATRNGGTEQSVGGVQAPSGSVVYRARLRPMNQSANEMRPSGVAVVTTTSDSMIIEVQMRGVAPEIMHMQHIHGFVNGMQASCPTEAQDANYDGIVDLIETENVSGITLIPFHGNPASLELLSGTYPVADNKGEYSYRQAVPLEELRQALRRKHGIQDLALEERLVFVHGVDPRRSLPNSVSSLTAVPPSVTVPVACGRLVRVETVAEAAR